MKKCIIVVRNYKYTQPSDEYLKALDWIYVSPPFNYDPNANVFDVLDEFDEKHRKFYSDFLHPNFEIVEV